MSNSRSWFRRRRPIILDEGPAARIDPFLNESALELGFGTVARPRPPAGPDTPPVAPAERLEAPERLHVPERLDAPERAEAPEPDRPGRMKRITRREPAEPHETAERLDRPEEPDRPAIGREAIMPAFPRRGDNRPRFAFVAPGAPPNGPPLHDAFAPTRPQQEGGSFVGRAAEMRRIIAAIEEERAHVMLAGEHGSGRTSLVNMLAAKATAAGYVVARASCGTAAGFEDLMRGLLRQLPAGLTHGPTGLDDAELVRLGSLGSLADVLPAHRLGAAELAGLFAGLRERRVVLMLDDYDRVASAAVRCELAEFAKALSDAGAPVTLLLVGLGDDVPRFFADHPSLRRTMVAVPMAALSDEEIGAILAAGEAKTGWRFDETVRRAIVDLAQGQPYPAHLLGLFATHGAVARQARLVEQQDLREAARRIGDDRTFLLKAAYDRALGAEPQATEDLLFFAARCRGDAAGTFDASDIAGAAARAGESGDAIARLSLLSLHHGLDRLAETGQGAILRRLEGPPVEPVYRFACELMRAYVLIRQAERRGLI